MDLSADHTMRNEIKENITLLISQKKLEQARTLLESYRQLAPQDVQYYSILSALEWQAENFVKAKQVITEGLSLSAVDFDLLYNQAVLWEREGEIQSATNQYHKMLRSGQYSKEQNDLLKVAIDRLNTILNNGMVESKVKITFLVKSGMDSFIDDIIRELAVKKYETKKTIVTDMQQIESAALEADILWFEWCDELLVYASHQSWANSKKIVCRLHSYEAFTHYVQQVEWNSVDRIIFVAEHIRDYVLQQVSSINSSKTVIIPNGIDLKRYTFKKRVRGYNIAYVGYINYKKGPMLLLHTFKAIYDMDPRYKLYIAGTFQDGRYVLYFQQMIKELGLEKNIFYEGWQSDINSWLDDKNYILSTSVLEGNPLGVMEAMARGIKPLIHNFVGSKKQFPKYVWSTIDECVSMVKDPQYNSTEYLQYVEKYFSLDKQIDSLCKILSDIVSPNNQYKKEYLIDRFLINSDDMINTEQLFGFLLDENKEKEYMSYLQSWFVRSQFPMEIQMKYYYGNLYRKMTRYTRFSYLNEAPYQKLDTIGNSIFSQLESQFFSRRNDIKVAQDTKIKVLFILHGLDCKQIVSQFYVDLISASKNKQFEYYVLSSLHPSEFQNAEVSIEYFKKHGINVYVPSSVTYEERIAEFYGYISKIKPMIAIFQSIYFAPIHALIFPLLQKVCNYTGRVVHQQAEPFYDKRIDFAIHYLTNDRSVQAKEFFDVPWPMKTQVLDKNLDIYDKFDISENKKVVVSLARDVYFKENRDFWHFVVELLEKNDQLVYVVFGPLYDESYSKMIPEEFIKDKKIIFAGFDINAAAYLKSCSFFLNTFPLGGGSSLQEAYYAGLPIITFSQEYNEEMNVEQTSFLIPSIWYKDAATIFPRVGNFGSLFEFSNRLVNDEEFRVQIQQYRKISIDDMSYEGYVIKLEQYILHKIDKLH